MRPLRAGPARAAPASWERLWGRLWGWRWIWLLLPWLLVVAVAAVQLADGLGGHVVRAGPLLSPVPALAAIRGRSRDVLAVTAAALAVGALTLPGPGRGSDDGNAPTVLVSLAVVGLAALVASTARQRREGQLVRIRQVAEAAQLALLSPVPPRAHGLRLAAGYSAAETDTLIGGDLYEVVAGRDCTRLIVGDVRGKGLPAIRTAAVVLGAFREAAHYEEALTTVAGRCSRAVARCAEDMGGEEADELFVTAVLMEIDATGMRVVDLGHPPPLLLTPAGCLPLEVEPLPPLGLVHRFTEDRADGWGQTSHPRCGPGDRLVLYTDGIDEARDEDGRFFPLIPALSELGGAPVDRLPQLLLEAVDRHTGRGLRDDAAVLVVEFEPVRGSGEAVAAARDRGSRGRLPDRTGEAQQPGDRGELTGGPGAGVRP